MSASQSEQQGILPDDCLVPSTGPTRDFTLHNDRLNDPFQP